MKRICTTAVVTFGLGVWSSIVLAGPRVEIVVGTDAPKLTRFAAAEMSGQLKTLFDADVAIRNTANADAPHTIFLGEPQTNPALAQAIGANWPKVSDQGIVIKTIGPADKRQLIVVGGSPVATLWAVYELGHRYGLRYLLSGDALPAKPARFTLDNFDILLEPKLKVRAWQLMGSFPFISNAWGLEDQQKLVRQLAKLKFNHIVLRLEVTGPFFSSALPDTMTTSAYLFHGHHFAVDGDTPGRKAFKGAKEFINPDFAGKTTVADTTAAGQRLVGGIVDAAHDVGMTVGVELLNQAWYYAAGKHVTDDKMQIRFRDCLKEFPSLDTLYMNDSFRKNKAFVASLGKDESQALDKRRELQIVFVDPVAQEDSESPPPSDAWYLQLVLPLNPSPVVQLKKTLVPTSRTTVVLPLGSYAGVVPQECRLLAADVVSELRKSAWNGLQVSGLMVGDLDPVVQYLARASFDASATPDSVCHDLFDTLCGSPEVTNRLIQGFNHIEQANKTLGKPHLWGWAYPDPNCLKNIGSPDPERVGASKVVTDFYLQAMNEMFRAHDNCHPSSRRYIYYYARRCEFAFQYMNFVQAYYAAEEARAKKDTEARLEQLGKAVEALYNGLNSLGDVARDQSDRGAIAVLTEFAYRPLVKQLDNETEEAEKGQ